MAGAFDPTAPGFDVTAMVPTPGAPAPSQPPAGEDRKKWLRLIPIVAAAARGGPGALEGVMQGLQQAQLLKQQQATQDAATQRQTMLDQQTLQQQQHQRQYQTGQLDADRARNSSALMKQFTEALNEVEDPDAVRGVIELYEGQGRQFGIPPGRFQSAAMQVVKPSALEKKAAEKKVNGLRTQFGVKWLEEGAKFTHQLPGGKTVSFQELLGLAGMTPDPNAPQAAPASQIDPNIPLDRQHAMALVSGNEALAKQIEQAMSRQDATRRDPQRQPIQITVGDSGLTQQQIAAAAGLRDDFRTESKDFFASRDGYERVLAAADDPSAAGDLALLYGFMKILDPNSVVRETEFAQAARSGSLPQQIQAQATRLINGQRLTPQQRADFLNRAKALFGKAQNRHNSRRTNYQKIARQSGVPEDLVIQDDAPVDENVTTAPAAPAATNADPLGIR